MPCGVRPACSRPPPVSDSVRITEPQAITPETALTFPGRSHEWLRFGNSNSPPLPPEILGYDRTLAVDTFRNAYTQAVQTTLSRGILAVRHTLTRETEENDDTASDAGNVSRLQLMDQTLMRNFTTGSFGSSK